MANISSPIEQIDDLWLDNLPAGKPVAAEKVVRVDETIVIVAKNGRLYVHGRAPHARYSYTFGKWPWTDALMKALAKAGVITKEAAKQHTDRAAKREAERTAKHRAERLEHAASEAGIRLTQKQLAQVSQLKGDAV